MSFFGLYPPPDPLSPPFSVLSFPRELGNVCQVVQLIGIRCQVIQLVPVSAAPDDYRVFRGSTLVQHVQNLADGGIGLQALTIGSRKDFPPGRPVSPLLRAGVQIGQTE